MKFFIGATLIGCTFLLGGCAEIKRTLGLEKSPPNEFDVVDHAPLVVPPHAGLRPPSPGMPRPQEKLVQESIREAILLSDPQSQGVIDKNIPLVEEVLVDSGSLEAVSGIEAAVPVSQAQHPSEEDPTNVKAASPDLSGSQPSEENSADLLRHFDAQGNAQLRSEIDKEASEERVNIEADTLGRKIAFWQEKPAAGEAIDPVEEKNRLEAYKKARQGLNQKPSDSTKMSEPSVENDASSEIKNSEVSPELSKASEEISGAQETLVPGILDEKTNTLQEEIDPKEEGAESTVTTNRKTNVGVKDEQTKYLTKNVRSLDVYPTQTSAKGPITQQQESPPSASEGDDKSKPVLLTKALPNLKAHKALKSSKSKRPKKRKKARTTHRRKKSSVVAKAAPENLPSMPSESAPSSGMSSPEQGAANALPPQGQENPGEFSPDTGGTSSETGAGQDNYGNKVETISTLPGEGPLDLSKADALALEEIDPRGVSTPLPSDIPSPLQGGDGDEVGEPPLPSHP